MTAVESAGPRPEAEPSVRRAALTLLCASFLVLFQELAIIRWLPSQVRVLAYFPNLILISAFLGLGVGCLRAGQRSLAWLWPLSLIALALSALGLGRVAFSDNSASEHLWLLYFDLPENARVVDGVRLPIIFGFVVSAVTFVPLGQIVARQLGVFRSRSSPLWGYSWDILGSLLGVVGFTALSFVGARPLVWFSLLLGLGCVFFAAPARRLAAYLAAAACVLVLVASAERAEIYSPYYAISVRPAGKEQGFGVLTNGSLHQFAFDARENSPTSYEAEEATRAGYRLPYRLLGRPPGRVLVLGAGTGNDVATLIEMGATSVDAVEIDPVILRLGRERHPNRPYSAPQVRAINTDARSFLNGTPNRYDLVVFGTLDSMTRLSALSNVRLDNFVYTRECLEAARRRLAPGGGVVMFFMVGAEYIDKRLTGLLTETFGEVPYFVAHHYTMFNRALMVGPAFEHLNGPTRRAAAQAMASGIRSEVELPSDDWPYLYLARRGISRFYLSLIAVFAFIGVAAVLIAAGRGQSAAGARWRVDWEMFLFGLAFLLLETKAVTDMSLVWGATWLTSAVVFGAILLTILAATILTQRRPPSWTVVATGLVLALLAVYALPVRFLLSLDLAQRLGLSVLFVGAPIFFAACAFALLFGSRPHSNEAFGWNVIGAVAGGLLEFGSMALGLRALALLALAAYLLAFLVRLRSTRMSVEARAGV